MKKLKHKMKYLKLFENYENTYNDDILYCFQDLIDNGFEVNCSRRYIQIFKENRFYVDDVKEVLLFALPYMKSEFGIKVEKIDILNSGRSFDSLDDFLNSIVESSMSSIFIYVY